MKTKAWRRSKTFWVTLCMICTACAIFTVAAVAQYMFASSKPADALRVSAKNDVSYSVCYLDNKTFGSGARPMGQNYLISYTDYIEMNNEITADFSHRVNVSYQYFATTTLMIKHQKSSDQNANPVVFEKRYLLFEANGSIIGDHIALYSTDTANNPGGVYRINPNTYISIVKNFVSEQREKMQKEGVTSTLKLSADLLVEYSCHLTVDENEIDETLTRGVSIPLLDEVFMPADTGNPSLELSVAAQASGMPGPLYSVLLVLWLAALIFGICYSIRQLSLETDRVRHEVAVIFKKYSDEIVISAVPIDLSEYKTIPVLRFQELSKLAVNASTCILCFQNEEKANFCAISDQFAYTYNLRYDIKPRRVENVFDEYSGYAGLSAETDALFEGIDSFIAETSRKYRSLNSFLKVINSFDDGLLEPSLLEKLNAYRVTILAVRNHLKGIPSYKQMGLDVFLEKLECFELRLQSCIERIEAT